MEFLQKRASSLLERACTSSTSILSHVDDERYFTTRALLHFQQNSRMTACAAHESPMPAIIIDDNDAVF